MCASFYCIAYFILFDIVFGSQLFHLPVRKVSYCCIVWNIRSWLVLYTTPIPFVWPSLWWTVATSLDRLVSLESVNILVSGKLNKICCLNLAHLSSAKLIPLTKIAFTSIRLVNLWENGQGWESGYGLSNDSNLNPPTWPFPHFGVETKQNAKIGFPIFKCQNSAVNVNILQSTTSSGEVVRLDDVCVTNFKLRYIIKLFSQILVNLFDRRKRANFVQPCFLNDWFDLDVQYTVEKSVRRSANGIGDVFHLRGQNIGPMSYTFGFQWGEVYVNTVVPPTASLAFLVNLFPNYLPILSASFKSFFMYWLFCRHL